MELVYKKAPSHTCKLLSNLKSNGDFCDITIKCGSFQVAAHRCVLTASTEYFRRMLLTDTQEARTGIVNFPAMKPEIAKQCVDFIYSGSAGLSMTTARGLIDAAEMLQLPVLSDLCGEFLAESIDLNNFAEVVSLSCLYNKTALNTQIAKFLVSNLKEIVGMEDFKAFDYDTVGYCYDLMQGSSPAIEMLKWTGLLAWTNADREKRETGFHDLFLKINLQYLPSEFVTRHICTENIIDGSIKSLKYVRQFIAGELPSVSPGHLTAIDKSTRSVSQCQLRDKKWTEVCKLPSAIRSHASVAEHNGVLYVGDGVSLYSFSDAGWKCLHQIENGHLFVSHYNRVVCARRWVIMVTVSLTVVVEISSGDVHEEYHQFTEGFFVSGLQAKVYVLGGIERSAGSTTEIRTVEAMKLKERCYSAFNSMVMGRAYGAGIQHKGYLYAMGGRSRTVEFHNTWTRQWQVLRGRAVQCRNVMHHVADRLYIFGGALGTEVKTVRLDWLEITAKELRPTRRSGDMDVRGASRNRHVRPRH